MDYKFKYFPNEWTQHKSFSIDYKGKHFDMHLSLFEVSHFITIENDTNFALFRCLGIDQYELCKKLRIKYKGGAWSQLYSTKSLQKFCKALEELMDSNVPPKIS